MRSLKFKVIKGQQFRVNLFWGLQIFLIFKQRPGIDSTTQLVLRANACIYARIQKLYLRHAFHHHIETHGASLIFQLLDVLLLLRWLLLWGLRVEGGNLSLDPGFDFGPHCFSQWQVLSLYYEHTISHEILALLHKDASSIGMLLQRPLTQAHLQDALEELVLPKSCLNWLESFKICHLSTSEDLVELVWLYG